MSNTITIELCPEDRARIDRLIAAMERKTCEQCVATALDVMKQKYEAPAAPVAKEAPAETAQEHPVDASQDLPWDTEAPAKVETPAEPETPTEPAKEAVVPPLTDLQNMIIELTRKGLKEKAREIVQSYGAERASAVPEDKRAELLDKLNELKKLKAQEVKA